MPTSTPRSSPISRTSGLLLDVGAGSGGDANWFAAQGWDVVAAEPVSAMRAAATGRHASTSIRWIDDRLPGLSGVHQMGLAYDLI